MSRRNVALPSSLVEMFILAKPSMDSTSVRLESGVELLAVNLHSPSRSSSGFTLSSASTMVKSVGMSTVMTSTCDAHGAKGSSPA